MKKQTLSKKQQAYRKSLLTKIHLAPKYVHHIAKYEDDYRSMLQQHFGKRSAANLNINQLIVLLDFLNNKRTSPVEHVSKAQMDYIKKGWQLKGIEVPINIKLSESVRFIGFLDVVMYHEPTNTYKIIDIKTSTMGWNKWMKADKTKTSQLLLYKRFLAEQWKVSVEQIDVEYFIVKRRLYEKADFPQKRVQKFVPANGSVSMNRASNGLAEFIAKSFTDDGQFITEQPATPSKKACKWCEFRKTEHCDEGV